MVTNSTVSAPQTERVTNPARVDSPRISTRTLGTALFVLNTLAGGIVYCYNPSATLAGAVLGASIRRISGDNPQPSTELSDKDRRINRAALICLTCIATLYTHATYTPALGGTAAVASTVAPFFVGLQGVTNGIYPLIRRFVD